MKQYEFRLLDASGRVSATRTSGDRFLRKPFQVDTLTRAVSELAAGQGVAGFEHALS